MLVFPVPLGVCVLFIDLFIHLFALFIYLFIYLNYCCIKIGTSYIEKKI